MFINRIIPSVFIVAGFLGQSLSASAEEKLNPPFEFTGYADIYYQNSPDSHKSVSTSPAHLEGRPFDNLTGEVVLNMVELSAKRKSGDVAFRADFAFGQMVDVLAGSGTITNGQPDPANSQESTRNVTQATLTYTPSNITGLTIVAGKFYSLFGYETTKAKDNWQYSRSLSFHYAIPYWHEGLSAQYAFLPDKFSATVQFVNDWDGRLSADANKSPAGIVNLNFTPVKGLALNYNYITGKYTAATQADRVLHEFNATYTTENSQFALGADYVMGSQDKAMGDGSAADWNALGLYFKYSPNAWYTLSPRFEIFDDSDKGYVLGGGVLKQKINSITIANNFTIGDGLEARLEYRTDKSDEDGFYKDDEGQNSDQQESYAAAFLYSF